MLKPMTLALMATLGLVSGAYAQEAYVTSTPDSATVNVYHDGNVDTTTCSSSVGSVYCHSYTTTEEAVLIGDALEKMLPADNYEEGGGSISALKVLPDALKDAMRESCAGRGFWKQMRDPDCKPMAEINAAMALSLCLGSHDLPSSEQEYDCSSLYDRAYQQYLTNLKRGADSRGFPLVYRLKTRDEVLWEFAPTFLPVSLLRDTSKQFPDGFTELNKCLPQFRSASDLATDSHCAALYNRAVELFNAAHQHGRLTYTKVAAE